MKKSVLFAELFILELMFKRPVAYNDKPRFNIGSPNQWYEDGFFYHEGNYYLYSDDRHDNNYDVNLIAESKKAFIEYCGDANTDIPESFWTAIKALK